MFGYPFLRQQQQSPRYYAPSQNPRKRYVRDEFGNVYLVPDNTYYPRNIDLEEYYYPQHHRQQQQQHFNSIHEEDEEEGEESYSDDEPTQFESDNYHHRNRLVSTPQKQSQHHQQRQKQQKKPTRIPINTNNSHSQQQQQPTKVTHKQKETKIYTLAEQANAAVVIQKVFRGRRVRRDSPIAKLSTLHSTQKAANELFLQADNENILEEGHVFESNTPCVGNVPRALAQLDHELTKLLLVLDSVGSGFSEEVQTIVRSKRKEVAQNIELMLTAVDVAKRTCVIRPLTTAEQPEHPIANTNTNTTTIPSDSPVDVEMQSVDCDNIMIDEGEQSNNTPTETQPTSNTLSLSSETTIPTPQTTNDTPSSELSHNQPFNIDPAFEDITELIDQQNEKNESNTSDSEDWVVLPSDSVDMEIAATTPSTNKPSHSTIPSLKNLSYNACDKIIKSALLRTPVAC